MKIEALYDKKPCEYCKGYGAFNISPSGLTLGECRHCHSINAETLGFRYINPEIPVLFLYVIHHFKFCDWLKRILKQKEPSQQRLSPNDY